MHFAGMGSKAGTMLILFNMSFNIHLLTVNEYYMLTRLIKLEIKKTYCKYNVMAVKHKNTLMILLKNIYFFNFKNLKTLMKNICNK